MEREPNPSLESVAEAVSDGLPVDWEGLKTAAPTNTEQLNLLRLFQELIAAHAAVREPRPKPEPE